MARDRPKDRYDSRIVVVRGAVEVLAVGMDELVGGAEHGVDCWGGFVDAHQ